MDRRGRVMAALRGERPDRIPVSFWWHDYARENSAADLAEATASSALNYDFDFIKVQSRFTVFAECWGGRWSSSARSEVPPVQLKPALRQGSDLDIVASHTPNLSPLDEQIEALRSIKRRLADDRPVLMTVFSPLMALALMFPDTPEPRAATVAALREDPERGNRALAAIADVLRAFAVACTDAGADGIFFASNLASRDLTTIDDLRRFERPHDLGILASVDAAPFNLVHVCGPRTHFEEFADYPADAFSWTTDDGNPGLLEGRWLTGRAVVGGITAKPALRTMSAAAVAREAADAVRATGGAGLLLSAGCSIDVDTPEANLRSAIGVARPGRV